MCYAAFIDGRGSRLTAAVRLRPELAFQLHQGSKSRAVGTDIRLDAGSGLTAGDLARAVYDALLRGGGWVRSGWPSEHDLHPTELVEGFGAAWHPRGVLGEQAPPSGGQTAS